MIKALVVVLLIFAVFCLDNGVGRTPPMGWNSGIDLGAILMKP